jgi:hypothetical protein
MEAEHSEDWSTGDICHGYEPRFGVSGHYRRILTNCETRRGKLLCRIAEEPTSFLQLQQMDLEDYMEVLREYESLFLED